MNVLLYVDVTSERDTHFEGHHAILGQHWDVKHQAPHKLLHHGGTHVPAEHMHVHHSNVAWLPIH